MEFPKLARLRHPCKLAVDRAFPGAAGANCLYYLVRGILLLCAALEKVAQALILYGLIHKKSLRI